MQRWPDLLEIFPQAMSINEHCLLWTVRIKHFKFPHIWVPERVASSVGSAAKLHDLQAMNWDGWPLGEPNFSLKPGRNCCERRKPGLFFWSLGLMLYGKRRYGYMEISGDISQKNTQRKWCIWSQEEKLDACIYPGGYSRHHSFWSCIEH